MPEENNVEPIKPKVLHLSPMRVLSIHLFVLPEEGNSYNGHSNDH